MNLFAKPCPVCAVLTAQLEAERDRSRDLTEQIVTMKRDGFQPPPVYPEAEPAEPPLSAELAGFIERMSGGRGPLRATLYAEARAHRSSTPEEIKAHLRRHYTGDADE